MYDLIITISDNHAPYGHPDTPAFLRSIKEKYWKRAKKPLVVVGGDEQDGHAISFHDSDPDLMSASDELKTAINRLKPIYAIFPKATVLESNHGSLFYRRMKTHGIPRFVVKAYREVIEAPKTWHWVPDLTVKMSNGQLVYMCHGKIANVLQLSQTMGMSVVQFHYHEKFSIQYWANPVGLYWAAQAGCLIDDSSLAFAYNKLNRHRPIIGTVVVVNGHPVLEPMVLKENGRWVGHLVGAK